MDKKYNSIVTKYKLLPGFLQKKALYKFYYDSIMQIDPAQKSDDAIEFTKEMFKATKNNCRVDFYNKFIRHKRFERELINSIPINEQKEILNEIGKIDLMRVWCKIDAAEVKEELFPKMMELIENSNTFNSDLSFLANNISIENDSSYLLKHLDKVFQLVMKYDVEEYHAEQEKQINESQNPISFYAKEPMVILGITKKIFPNFTQEQKDMLGLKILKEIVNSDRPEYELNNIFMITRGLSKDIQEEYYDKLTEIPRSQTVLYEGRNDSFGEIWFALYPEVQSKHFDDEFEFLSKIDDDYNIQHFGNYGFYKALQKLWEYTNPQLQRKKAVELFNNDTYKQEQYKFLDLYEVTNGKLQSELLNRFMYESFRADSAEPTDMFESVLRSTSQDVFDRNFQYFFGKLKDKPEYVYPFLNAVSNEVKVKYSRAIGKYFSVNLESILTSSHANQVTHAATYLDSDSCDKLFENIFRLVDEKKELKNENGEIVDLSQYVLSFFVKMDSNKQRKIFYKTLEDKDKNNLFPMLFNIYNINDINEQKELLRKYYSINEYNSNQIIQALEKYEFLSAKNNSIKRTIDCSFLISDLSNKLTKEQLLRITHYKKAQEKILLYSDNNAIIQCFEYLMKQPENWNIVAEKVFANLNSNYSALLNDIKDKKLDENDCRNLLSILQRKNEFELSSYEDVKNYNAFNGKRMQSIFKVLKGDYSDLPPIFKNLTEDEMKKKAVLEFIVGSTDVEHLLHNYYKGIEGISELKENEAFNKELRELKKFLNACNFVKNSSTTEIDGIIANIISKPDTVVKYSALDIESRIINLYGKSIEAGLYRPTEHQEDLINTIEYDDNGIKKKVQVYKINDKFDTIVRVEGAYSSFEIPDNYVEYFDVPRIDSHGNCESIIGNDMIAPAKNSKNAITVAYSKIDNNSLLLLGPKDLGSALSNMMLAPINHQQNCTFYGIKDLKDNTRHTHNEIVMERIVITENGQVDKLKPNYLIWFQEEINEKFPISGEDEYSRWENTQKAAAQLGVPIVIINREHFAIKEMNEMRELEKIVKGEEKLPEGREFSTVMADLLCKMENNSNSLRFSEKIKSKYFTMDDRERINSVIETRLEELIKTNPENAVQCIEAVKKRLEFEQQQSESSSISAFYDVKQQKLNKMSEKIMEFYDKEGNIETELDKMSNKKMFENSMRAISDTDYYKTQKQHSIEHIEKVMFFSKILAHNEGLSEEDTKILLAAAAFHDSSRGGQDGNVQHAKEGAITAKEYFSNNIQNDFGIKEEEIGIIQTAIDYHEYDEYPIGKVDRDYLMNIAKQYGVKEEDFSRAFKISELLKDADALDRTRFAKGGKLNSEFLRSGTAKSMEMIDFAKKVNDEYAGLMVERNYKVLPKNGENVSVLRECRMQNQVEEHQLSIEEMLELFSKVSVVPKIHTKELSFEEKLEFLFMDYGEAHITMDDVKQADEMIKEDAKTIQASRIEQTKSVKGSEFKLKDERFIEGHGDK